MHFQEKVDEGIIKLMNRKKGFTLIELLVVISIISVLSSVVLTQTKNARDRANDSKRISDLRAIRNALELYRNDHGRYPTVGGQTCNGTTGPQDWPAAFKTAMAPYINPLPLDPEHSKAVCTSGPGYYYYYGYTPSMNPPWEWTNSICTSATTPRPILLYNHGRPGGKRFVNECKFTYTNSLNTFYLNKPDNL